MNNICIEIKNILEETGYKFIEIKDGKIHFRKNLTIDLGGIAKGYAVDKAIDILKKFGITSAIVNAGGDLRAIGLKPNGEMFCIGVRHPRKENKIICSFYIKDKAVATSGDYERFIKINGIIYPHIIDPKTGYPSLKCQSVTIISNDTLTSDALSTAVFVMGKEKGLKFLNENEEIEGIIIDKAGNMFISNRLKNKVKIYE